MKKFLDPIAILVIWLLLLCLGPCHGADRFKWPVCTPGFTNANPIVQDIGQHYNPKLMPASTYQDADIVTWGHELTHAVNSNIRNLVGGSDTHQGLYLLNGSCVYFSIPKCTLYDVRARITQKGPSYQTYLINQMPDWHRNPLYLLDELQAYTNGTAVGIQAKLYERARGSLASADEFYRYALATRRAIQDLDPTWAELPRFQAYLDHIAAKLVDYHAKLN